MALNDIYKNSLKVPKHYSDSGGGGSRVKMSPDTILQPTLQRPYNIEIKFDLKILLTDLLLKNFRQ